MYDVELLCNGVTSMNKRVLVVAAHTDDEVLGCGGTIARHVMEGDQVYAVFMADGVSSRVQTDATALLKREDAAEKARSILGIRENIYLGLPDNRMDSMPLIDVVQCLEPIINRLKPHTIYTHHLGDLNVDHRITHQAVMTACRPMPGCSVREIFTFEVLSSTEWATPTMAPFLPNLFVDISAYLEIKMQALDAYAEEMRVEPHTRSLKHVEILARHRGFTVGLDAAEGYSIVRKLK